MATYAIIREQPAWHGYVVLGLVMDAPSEVSTTSVEHLVWRAALVHPGPGGFTVVRVSHDLPSRLVYALRCVDTEDVLKVQYEDLEERAFAPFSFEDKAEAEAEAEAE